MKRINLTVNIPDKTLSVDGKLMQLEDSFVDASIDPKDPEEHVLTLDYRGDLPEDCDDAILEPMGDKLRETYGERILGRLCGKSNIPGYRDGDTYSIIFYGEETDFAIER